MKLFPRILLAAATCLLVAACAPTDKDLNASVVPPSVIDPPDSAIDASVQAFLVSSHGPKYSQYDYTRVDLDGDGRRDALVMFSGPHSYWCDINGCSLTVFKASDTGFAPVSEIFPVRGPMYISQNATDGWRNLIVRVTGQSYAEAKDVALQFDGTKYPRNPFFEPGVQLSQADYGQRVFP